MEFPEPKKCWFCKHKTHFASSKAVGKYACEKHTKNGAKSSSERLAKSVQAISERLAKSVQAINEIFN